MFPVFRIIECNFSIVGSLVRNILKNVLNNRIFPGHVSENELQSVSVRWQDQVSPYIEMVSDEMFCISYNNSSFFMDGDCMERTFRSGWVQFDPRTGTFTADLGYPKLGKIVESIISDTYFNRPVYSA